MNPRSEIVSLLRGQVACPLLSCLGEAGLLDQMVGEAFAPADLCRDDGQLDRPALDAVLCYLCSLGLLEPADDNRFTATPLGRIVFVRFGAFCLLNSYDDYFRDFGTFLWPQGEARPQVNRARNVLGSGKLHERKFFPAALKILTEHEVSALCDVGCGDGAFLMAALGKLSMPVKTAASPFVLVSDLSQLAVETATKRVCQEHPQAHLQSVTCDGVDVACWSAAILPEARKSAWVSLWFVAHEFSQGRTERVVEFFEALHTHLPQAQVLLGEIVRLPESVLCESRGGSIMPEFLLFHALSGQGVLSWDEWSFVAKHIPYKIAHQELFDVMPGADGETLPSSFLWHLTPCEHPSQGTR